VGTVHGGQGPDGVSQTTVTKRSALPGVAREKLCYEMLRRSHTEAVVGRLGLGFRV